MAPTNSLSDSFCQIPAERKPKMTKTIFNYPDDDGGINSGISNKTTKLKFNEKALCREFIKRFHTMGILTSSETGLIINQLDHGNRPTL